MCCPCGTSIIETVATSWATGCDACRQVPRSLQVATAPGPLTPPYSPVVIPEQTQNTEVALSTSLAPLVPPGLPQAHVTGGFPYGALGLPFLFRGGGHGRPPPLLAALPPQFAASGGQPPHGFVPEGGLGAFTMALLCRCCCKPCANDDS